MYSGLVMSVGKFWQALKAHTTSLARNRRGNVAMIFALTLIPITIAAGAGLDLSRALIVRARLAEALDAAGLAVGATQNLSNAQITALANAYFKANYTADSSFGVPASIVPQFPTGTTDTIKLSTSVAMPTTLMNIVGINTINVGYTSTVVWGQTKLWVSLVLDNTGSMADPDNSGPNSKIVALKTATNQLLTTLQGASANPGDVKVAIIPFSKDVNIGTSQVSAGWLDWTDWAAAPANGTPATSVGPGSNCPYSTSGQGYKCQSTPTNGASNASTIPSSGTYKGYICPTIDNGAKNSGRLNHYYNGCYNSVPTQTQTTTAVTPTTVTSTASCTSTSTGTCTGGTTTTTSNSTGSTTTTVTTAAGYSGDSTNTTTANGTPSVGSPNTTHTGSGTHKVYTTTVVTTTVNTSTMVTKVGVGPYTHTWVANDHSTWTGCIMDRTQDYDISNTPATNTATYFPPENSASCVPSVMKGTLGYDWTSLTQEVNNMSAGGSTNQPIGLAWGWQALSQGDPLNAGTVPNNTSRYIILLSDGLNTQDRWYGDGSDQSTQVDARMTSLCTAAKADGITVYTIYVDLNGTQGNSTVLQNCATDSSKYFDLTTSGGIITTLATIAQQITQLRVLQ